LYRRIKEHTALIKDLPPGYRDELGALLAVEVRQLVEREADRLDRRMNFLLNLRRGAWIATFTTSGLSAFLTSTWDKGSVPAVEAGTVVTLAGIATAAFVIAVIASSAVRVHQRFAQQDTGT